MASAAAPFTPLAPEQRRLLLAALSSYKKNPQALSPTESGQTGTASSPASKAAMASLEGVNPSVFSNNAVDAATRATDAATTDPALALDYGAFDDSFNFDLDDAAAAAAAEQGQDGFEDSFTGFPFDTDGQGEKRKSPGEDSQDGDEEADPKRHEGDDKGSKKPGRKPLTSEPTTKRKAQNRAAQRAFRERKEKHLKDLETKVSDLEKASESANHENSVLRAQVERLQDQLKDYRRRLSNNGSVTQSSPASARPSMSSQRHSSANSIDNFDFSFDFPRFGESGSMSSTTMTNSNLENHQSSSALANDGLGSMFSTGFFEGLSNKPATASPKTFPATSDSPNAFNWASPSHSASASSRSPASSNQHASTSSSCTSPDETNWALNYNKSPGDTTFGSITGANTTKSPETTNTGTLGNTFDWLSSQNGGSFDPVLFGDYREPQDNIMGTGNFTGGFFEDSLSFPDFNDPFNFNTSTDNTVPAPVVAPSSSTMPQQSQKQSQKPSLLDQVAAQRDGGDEYDKLLTMPNEIKEKQPSLMACYKIWNQLQNCPRFHSGDFDIDNLCSELASKATCTETGLAIEKDKVEAALWKLAAQGDDGMAKPTA